MVAVIGVMIPIVATVGAYIMVVYLRRYQRDERMAMIEKGVSAELFKGMQTPGAVSWPLRASLLLMGAGLGILFGYMLDVTFYMREVAYFSMVLIFGGLGLGAAYLIEEKKIKEERRRLP